MYCDYHQDKGHNTDECYHLKKIFKKKIKAGELNQFVKDLTDKLGPIEDRENEADERERYQGEVKKISGGNNKTTGKKYAQQVYKLYQFDLAKQAMPITFTEDDYEDVIWLDEDPLIDNVIGQNKISKVLVDGGGSVKILDHQTYCKMNLRGEQLEPCHEAPLYSFRGQAMPIKGTITRSIILGKMPYIMEK